MSLNSLESEGLRPLCSLGLLWCSLGQIWPLTIAVQFCCFWFHVGLLLLSESQISVLVPWQQKFQGSFWLCFGFWPLATCPHLQLSYSSLKGLNPCYCSGTWVAVRTAQWQGGMLCYEDKMPLNVSPYRKDLLWLSSSHFFCRITNLSWLESLVQFGHGQMFAFAGKVSKGKSGRVSAFSLRGRNFFSKSTEQFLLYPLH